MLRPRIIPSLLIHEGGLVKTVGFREPKYVGDPLNAVRIFNEKESDELAVFDIDASVNGVEPNFKAIAELASECRMPLCYGGGVKTVEDAKRIISLGAEKVALSSAALADPSIVSAITREVGSQSVVVVLDVKKRMPGSDYYIYTHNGTRNTKMRLAEGIELAQASGAGEVVINAIDQDGRMRGYDLVLAKRARELCRTPLTLLGGAGSPDDIAALIGVCGTVGAAAGSMFVFKGAYRAVLINYPDQAAKERIVAEGRSRCKQ